MNLRSKTKKAVYEGRMIECTEEEYPQVRQTLLDLMSEEGRSEAATQVASAELQRLDTLFKNEDESCH
ncbi:MAG: hypothetical protein ACXABY_19515 [Candidatus Thorarchaeota archaeon]|jgi:hypothetical protein